MTLQAQPLWKKRGTLSYGDVDCPRLGNDERFRYIDRWVGYGKQT